MTSGKSNPRPSKPILFLHVEGDDDLRVPFQTLLKPWRETLSPFYDFKVVMGDSNNTTRDD